MRERLADLMGMAGMSAVGGESASCSAFTQQSQSDVAINGSVSLQMWRGKEEREGREEERERGREGEQGATWNFATTTLLL